MIISENTSIASLTTFKIGGNARYLFSPENTDDMMAALRFIKENNLPHFILGAGSNVLVGSGDYRGAVISTLRLSKIKTLDKHLLAQAGTVNSDLAQYACDHSIAGFEFLYAMPGTVGGSTVMNARAFGSSMSDIIIDVTAINKDLELGTFSNADIAFDYKKSLFQSGDYTVTEARFMVQKGNRNDIEAIMRSNKEKRLATGQYLFPSAGCIFKNDYSIGSPTGKLIDELGLKGERVGDAEVYPEHANFIINHGNATSDDVLALIDRIKQRAREEKNIELDCEIQFLGNL